MQCDRSGEGILVCWVDVFLCSEPCNMISQAFPKRSLCCEQGEVHIRSRGCIRPTAIWPCSVQSICCWRRTSLWRDSICLGRWSCSWHEPIGIRSRSLLRWVWSSHRLLSRSQRICSSGFADKLRLTSIWRGSLAVRQARRRGAHRKGLEGVAEEFTVVAVRVEQESSRGCTSAGVPA